MSCMRRHALFMLVALAIAATAAPVTPLLAAEGGKRLALVVGNSAYENVAPLINPANDATDIAQKLKSLGFEVLLATNAGQGKMSSLLQDFRNRLTREHVALIFFAGHGVTVNNESFLIPVDAPAEIDLDEKGDPRAEAVHRHLVSMASVLSPLDAAKIGIVFLDACRTNAAQPDLSLRVVSLRTNRAVQILRGTGSMEIKPSPYSAGVFRAYATQLDNVASDGSGRNSPFTKALIKHIGTKGISIQELMIRVRKSVMEETANKQVPWEEAALNESFYFISPATTPVPSSPGAAPAKSTPSPQRAPARSSGPARSNLPPNVGGGVGAGL
ncbi:MAG: caspase family protein [Alphaproteobacteria bacterium]|nr:MAG: caspase family protein [Alphaproteobacteria bacterium]